LGKTVLFNFVFPRRYVAKMTGKSVFSDKITGKKGLFCRRLFFEKPFFSNKTTHNVQPNEPQCLGFIDTRRGVRSFQITKVILGFNYPRDPFGEVWAPVRSLGSGGKLF
jgi:hypothetical protein